MNQNYIFFIRAYNDIDHMMPLICRFGGSKEYCPILFCTNPKFRFWENKNIEFLKKEYNIRIQSLYELPYCPKAWKFLFEQNVNTSICMKRFGIPFVFRQINAKMLSLLNKSAEKWLCQFFKEFSPRGLIFDQVSIGLYINRPLVSKAREAGIPTFSLPHGMNLCSNFDVLWKTDRHSRTEEIFEFDFDYVISQGRLSRSHLENNGVPPERITDLGSMRFDRNWMKFYKERIKEPAINSGQHIDALRVVLYLSNLHYKIKKDLLLETIELLAVDPQIHLIVKPHTRDRLSLSGMSVSFMKHLKDRYNIEVGEGRSSILLSEWADAALVIGSSIGLQVLFDKKALIYPNYLDTNKMAYDQMKACWRVDSPGELKQAIETLKKDKTYRPYSESNVEELFKYVVYADDLNKDIVEDHYQFITNEAAKR